MHPRWFVPAILAVPVSLLAGVARGQVITEFPIPTASSGVLGITAAFDGNLWFTEQSANKLGRITTAGVITEFPLPVAGTQPARIITGPDGGLWFTEAGRSFIGHLTTAGSFAEIPLSRSGDASRGITVGSDGAVWFAEAPGNRIGRIGFEGVATAFLIPTASSGPSGITAGPDGSLWFTENAGNKIGRITTAGVITEFAVPTPGSGPVGIVAGPDGNLWFTETAAGKVGRITTAGAFTEFPVGSAGDSITTGSDGNLWFVEGTGKIGRMTPSGALAEFAVPAGSNSLPAGIAPGPDGNIWFTEFNGNKIGRLTTGTVSSVLPVVVSAPGVPPSFFKTSVQLHNPSPSLVFGAITFHPQGVPGTTSDPTATYGLHPYETAAADDVLPAFGQSGIGTLDLNATIGPAPVSVVRIFNDAGTAGTTGFNEEQTRPGDALSAGSSGILLAPPDFTSARFNIGVRTLASGASMTITIRDRQGNPVRTLPKSFAPTFFVQGSASDFLGAPLSGGESITFSIDSGSAVLYGATADNITQDPSLQLAALPSTTGGTRVLPVVLSSPGALGSFFKTAAQIHNSSALSVAGVLIFHRSGVPGGSGDPSLLYSLGPHQTIDFTDLLPVMGQSGVGTLDLVATAGPAPLTVVRIYNDAGAAGTTGFNEDQIRTEDALSAGQRAVMVAPIDPSKFRFNIGVRTLTSGASITVTVRNAKGEVTRTVPKTYPATFFQQGSAADFLGASLDANSSIEILVDAGSLIVYGATADNTTQDPSLQVAKKVI